MSRSPCSAQGFIIERQQASGVAHQLFAFCRQRKMSALLNHQRRTALALQLLSWALTAEVERDRRSAAGRNCRTPCRSQSCAGRRDPALGKRFSIIIPIFRTFILNVVIFEIVLWHRERQGSTGPAKRALAVRKEIKKPIRTLSAYCRQG